MNHDSVIDALAEQVECYRRLARLAEVQHTHVQQGQTEQLLEVLKSRQEVLDRVSAHEAIIAPARRRWAEFVTELAPASRQRAESLLAETRRLLEQITVADRNDSIVLQQRKINLGRQIGRATAARQINKNYSRAAYGARHSQMDIQL